MRASYSAVRSLGLQPVKVTDAGPAAEAEAGRSEHGKRGDGGCQTKHGLPNNAENPRGFRWAT